MGTPKLKLPWPSQEFPDDTVLDSVLRAWTSVDSVGSRRTIVVLRRDDTDLSDICKTWNVNIAVPSAEPPQDMKSSLQIGVRWLMHQRQPLAADFCFIAPADIPGLDPRVIQALIEAHAAAGTVRTPMFGDQSGHPALVPWSIACEALRLPDDRGVDFLIRSQARVRVPLPADWQFSDINTPEEYERAKAAHAKRD